MSECFRHKVFLLLLLCIAVKGDRKVKAELNPGCHTSECKNGDIILVHMKAEGPSDTLHHLWDFSGKPTLLLALTDKNASLSVDWDDFAFGKEQTVVFEPPPKYVYGILIDQVIEFNDEKDTGEFDHNIRNSSYVSLLDTKNFDWKLLNFTNNSFVVEATGYDDKAGIKKNGTVNVMVNTYGGEDHAEALPHLLHSGNASELGFTINKLSTQYKHPRFGLHLVTASSDNRNDTVNLNTRKTLDDQHAPGIFTIVEMLSPSVGEGQCGGYIQWRPVVYTSPEREMTVSTESMQYPVGKLKDSLQSLKNTLVYSTLGTQLIDMLVVDTYVTFGGSGDGFFNKTNYATWTMVAGYGHPPEEQFSMLVTLVLLIGLGLPAVLILIGTICIVLRRLQRNKDDLYLSR